MGTEREKTITAASSPSSDGGPVSDESIAEPGRAVPGNLTRGLVVALALASVTLFWLVGAWVGFPTERGFQASILQDFSAGKFMTLVCAAILLGGCTLAGQLLAGHRWLYAGLFAACCGLAAWSCRGGPSRYVLFLSATEGDGRSVFLSLAVEAAILCGFVGVIWYWLTSRALALSADQTRHQRPVPPAQRIQGIAIQVLATTLFVMILTPIDSKKEVLASVLIASFIATSLVENWAATARLGPWYWVGPTLAAVMGYVLNFLANTAHAPQVNGDLYGLFAPLGRPLPLDYASAGMIGAMLGYYTTRADDFPMIREKYLDGVRKLLGASLEKPAAASGVGK